MPPQNDQAAAARAMLAANSLMGRYQGPELFHSQAMPAMTAPQTINIPRVLNITRPIESFTITMRGRIGVTVGPYTAVAPEAPQNLLQRIRVTGIHRKYGNLTPINITGATAFVLPRIFQSFGNDLLIGGVRAADPGRPFVSPFTGAIADHDFVIMWNVPVGPLMGIGQSLKRQGMSFLWTPQDWSDSLQMSMDWGDSTALGDNTGATVALTAFGSATGTPQLSVHVNYAIAGQLAAGMTNQGTVVRSEQTLTGNTGLATQARLTVLQKQITTGLLLKTGVLETTSQSAGVTTFESLSDLQLDKTIVTVDNKPIRNNSDNLVQKDYYARMFNTIIPQGYLNLSFVEGQNAMLAYRGDGLPAGAQFELLSDIISANANNRQSLIQEIVLGGPFPSTR